MVLLIDNKKVEKKKRYNIGDIVWYWKSNGMPCEFQILSSLKRSIFGRYYLTRWNDKDYLHGLPNWKTEKLYLRRIEGVLLPTK